MLCQAPEHHKDRRHEADAAIGGCCCDRQSPHGALIVYVTEIVPAEIRVCGFSLAYSLSQALFGGFTPLICTWLIDVTKDKAIPGAWLSATALCGLAGLAALRARGTTGKDGAAGTSAPPACS